MPRIPFESVSSDYPPFLPVRPVEVDPTNPDSVIQVVFLTSTPTNQPPLGNPSQISQEVIDLVGPEIGMIPDVQQYYLPPSPEELAIKRAAYEKANALGPQTPFSGGRWGDIAIRGPNGWILLPAGTAGLILQTNGPGANPSWADV